MTHKTILQQIGNTPLVKLDLGLQPTVLAKLEYLNPGGSLKDRSALFMIEDGERKGLLKLGGTIVEASSGNQGIALAMIGAVKGYKVIITVPDRTSDEKVATLRAYGAKVFVCPDTDNLDDPQGYHAKSERLAASISGSFMPNQYHNKLNARAHYETTGKELWDQTNGKITHFFAGTGSCGTISGVGRYLKEKKGVVKGRRRKKEPAPQLSFFGQKPPLLEELEKLEIDSLTPLEALTKLYELQKKAREG